MKRINLIVCLLATGIMTSFAAAQGLDMRLQHYQAKKFQAAVRSLQTRYKADFQPGTDWEKALQELEENRSRLIEGILISDLSRLTASVVIYGISYFIVQIFYLYLNLCTKIVVLSNSFK